MSHPLGQQAQRKEEKNEFLNFKSRVVIGRFQTEHYYILLNDEIEDEEWSTVAKWKSERSTSRGWWNRLHCIPARVKMRDLII